MRHEKGHFRNTLHRLFRRKANAQEKETFARWFSQLDLSEGLLQEGQEEAIKERIRLALKNHAADSNPQPAIVHFPVWLRSVAAAALIFAFLGIYLFTTRTKTIPQIAYQEIRTIKGERKTITLEDGTRIQLNNESTLKYPETFAGNTREVYLSGEAFFEVVHNPAKPFRAHIGRLNVQVLGTSFDIKGYKEDKNISVVVATGKVGVNKAGLKQAFMLLPGDRLSYNNLNGTITTAKVDTSDYTAWQRGELVFNEENLTAVCRRLERWYGVAIQIRDKSLLNKSVSLKIKGDDFTSVIKMLAITADFKYSIKDRTATLSR